MKRRMKLVVHLLLFEWRNANDFQSSASPQCWYQYVLIYKIDWKFSHHAGNNYYTEEDHELEHANKRMSLYHIDDSVVDVDQS